MSSVVLSDLKKTVNFLLAYKKFGSLDQLCMMTYSPLVAFVYNLRVIQVFLHWVHYTSATAKSSRATVQCEQAYLSRNESFAWNVVFPEQDSPIHNDHQQQLHCLLLKHIAKGENRSTGGALNRPRVASQPVPSRRLLVVVRSDAALD